MITAADFQSYADPGDKNLPMTEISGYQPVSRIGEVVMNAYVGAYEFSALKYQQFKAVELVCICPAQLPYAQHKHPH